MTIFSDLKRYYIISEPQLHLLRMVRATDVP